MHIGQPGRAHGNRAALILAVAALAAAGVARVAHAGPIVNDSWLDGTRTDPAAPTYSENGVDSDGDGNIESAWFVGGTGATLAPSAGHLVMNNTATSSSFTTYFTPESSPVTLANT